MADIVLPATMFMEHDDLYYGGGHQHISVGAKLIEPPGECRSNHEVLQGLGRRLNAVHPAFDMTPRELIDATLKKSGHGDIETLEADLWRDLQPDFRTSHYLDGFAHADNKFHFKADWANPPFGNAGMGPWEQMPSLPDHWTIIEEADEAHPFRLATSPSRSFLNTSFNETPSSIAREGAPSVMIHPAGCGFARDRRRRCRDAGQHARRDDVDRETVRRPAPRRTDRGIGPAEQGPYRRPRHQHADRRRGGRADRRRGVPRQQGVGEESGASHCAQELIRLAVHRYPAANVCEHHERNRRVGQ